MTAYTFRRIAGYESAYEALRHGMHVAEVERYDDRKWVAELNDGTRGFGRSRPAAIADAETTRKIDREGHR